jgi:hypothetical protein
VWSNTANISSVTLNAGERIEFQQVNGNPAWSETSAEVTVTAYFTTNE